jgi:hypothetical protein
MAERIIEDVLYAIDFHPQEMAMYGNQVNFDLRFAPMAEDADQPANEVPLLLVVQAHTMVQPSGGERRRFDLLKIGWQIVVASDAAVVPRVLLDQRRFLDHMLQKSAETVNQLAQQAGVEAALAPDLLDEIAAAYANQSQQ